MNSSIVSYENVKLLRSKNRKVLKSIFEDGGSILEKIEDLRIELSTRKKFEEELLNINTYQEEMIQALLSKILFFQEENNKLKRSLTKSQKASEDKLQSEKKELKKKISHLKDTLRTKKMDLKQRDEMISKLEKIRSITKATRRPGRPEYEGIEKLFPFHKENIEYSKSKRKNEKRMKKRMKILDEKLKSVTNNNFYDQENSMDLFHLPKIEKLKTYSIGVQCNLKKKKKKPKKKIKQFKEEKSDQSEEEGEEEDGEEEEGEEDDDEEENSDLGEMKGKENENNQDIKLNPIKEKKKEEKTKKK